MKPIIDGKFYKKLSKYDKSKIDEVKQLIHNYLKIDRLWQKSLEQKNGN